MGMQLPAFAPGSAHRGSEIPWMQSSYFTMSMKGVKKVEQMKEV